MNDANSRGHVIGCCCIDCRSDAEPLVYPNTNPGLNPTFFHPELGAGFDANIAVAQAQAREHQGQ